MPVKIKYKNSVCAGAGVALGVAHGAHWYSLLGELWWVAALALLVYVLVYVLD